MCGAQAQAAHLARQSPVSVAASVQSGRVVVLSVSVSVSVSGPVAVAVAVVVAGSGVSIIEVSGLGGGLRGLRFGGVRRFTAVTAVSAGDGPEVLQKTKRQKQKQV